MPNIVTYPERPAREPGGVVVSITANDENGICRLEAQGVDRPGLLFPSLSFDRVPSASWSDEVPLVAVASGIDVFTALCPPASAMTTLAERVRACREGRGGFAEPIRHPPPPPRPPVVTPGVRLCPTPSGGVAGCEMDAVCNSAKTDLEGVRRRAAVVCARIHELRRNRDEALTNALFFLVLSVVLLVLGSIANIFAVFGGATAAAALFLAAGVASALSATFSAMAEVFLAEMDARRDEYITLRTAYLNAMTHALTVCVCPGCGVPTSFPSTLPRCW